MFCSHFSPSLTPGRGLAEIELKFRKNIQINLAMHLYTLPQQHERTNEISAMFDLS